MSLNQILSGNNKWTDLKINSIDAKTVLQDGAPVGGSSVADIPLTDINTLFDTTFTVNYGKIIKSGSTVTILGKFLGESTTELRFTSGDIILLNNTLPYTSTQEFSKHITLNHNIVGASNSAGQVVVDSNSLLIKPGYIAPNTAYDVDFQITYITSD
jgi:hypothetical protein